MSSELTRITEGTDPTEVGQYAFIILKKIFKIVFLALDIVTYFFLNNFHMFVEASACRATNVFNKVLDNLFFNL